MARSFAHTEWGRSSQKNCGTLGSPRSILVPSRLLGRQERMHHRDGWLARLLKRLRVTGGSVNGAERCRICAVLFLRKCRSSAARLPRRVGEGAHEHGPPASGQLSPENHRIGMISARKACVTSQQAGTLSADEAATAGLFLASQSLFIAHIRVGAPGKRSQR